MEQGMEQGREHEHSRRRNDGFVSAQSCAVGKSPEAPTRATGALDRPVGPSAQRRLENQIRKQQCRMASGGEAASAARAAAAAGFSAALGSGVGGVTYSAVNNTAGTVSVAA